MDTQTNKGLGITAAILITLFLACGSFVWGKQFQAGQDKLLPTPTPTETSRPISLLPVTKGSDIGTGQITRIDEKSLTLKVKSGNSYTFTFTPTTQVVRPISSQKNELKIGDRVTVVAHKDSQGIFNTTYVQVLNK